MMNLSKIAFQALNDLPVGVFWFDKDARFLEVNKEACSSWGYTRDEFLNLTIFDVNPNIKSEMWDEHWINKQKDPSTFESMHKRKSGELFPVSITDIFVNYQGQVLCCAIITDITVRKQKEAALRGALTEIKELKIKLEEENNYLQEELNFQNNFDEIVTASPGFQNVLKQIEVVADTSSTVLVTGESGTGKELIARALHQLSRRSDRPLIKINCAALPANLIESELFGHEKGAFTGAIEKKIGKFELADGGSLFLDEIGDMPLELQPKLLRALQEGEIERVGGTKTTKVDVRFIAATNKNLPEEIQAGQFREELYYRLNVFPIHSIPLRERKEDIPLLVSYFCEKLGGKLGRKITNIPQKVINTLMEYDFPGNIRELENLIERGIIMSRGEKLSIGAWFNPKKKLRKPKKLQTLEEVQRVHIIEVLKYTNWKVSGKGGAADILDMRPTTLFSKIERLEIKRKFNFNEM